VAYNYLQGIAYEARIIYVEVQIMSVREAALQLHEINKGKLEVVGKVAVTNRQELSVAYTPGVAEPCKEIHKNPEDVYRYTIKGNLVAVVTDGSAVLGLGDIGPAAALPVMEGKALLFKAFANIDAVPICLDTQDTAEIVRTVQLMAPGFGGINLEDIAAPRCFEIERQLKELLNIPVFHDDQHGTAVVVLSGLVNALKFVGKDIGEVKVVINGAGSAGIAVAKLLLSGGVQNMLLCDRAGILVPGDQVNNPAQEEMALLTNAKSERGDLAVALTGADVFIGVSAGNIVDRHMVARMAKDSIVFAMANPVPEILPEEALAGGVRVMGTGRSDFPNQINNVLAFPGIFRGALDVRASDVNEAMKLAAAYAIAEVIDEAELTAEYIIPDPFDPRVVQAVAAAVAQAARASGVSRI
jgi:malate dehydrogenase (oxaloacetate-decarboxylating)